MNKARKMNCLGAEDFRQGWCKCATGCWEAIWSAFEPDAVSQRSGIRWGSRDRRLFGNLNSRFGVLFSGNSRQLAKNIPEEGVFTPDWAGLQ